MADLNQELPKTKEDWDKLAIENLDKWKTLTQHKMDITIRESREIKEKFAAAEQEKKNLMAELERERLEKSKQPLPIIQNDDTAQEYSVNNFPKSQEEWDNLFLEKPTFANDLRNIYVNRAVKNQEDFNNEWDESARKVVAEHPDLYIQELDDTGKPKTDGQGKPILKINPTTGWPIPNLENSEKGKIWIEICNEEDKSARAANRPNAFAVTGKGPLLMMAELERRLRAKGASMVNGQKDFTNDDSGTMVPPGNPPPSSNSIKFVSAEEEARAKSAVARGTFKSLEEWVQWRDKPVHSYSEANSRPDFTKR